MNINYLGNIYSPPKDQSWRDNSALTPTPFLLDEDTIRIYSSFRDPSGVGRIGYIDVSARDPKDILSISSAPVLDIGEPGCFDDNGIILGDIFKSNNEIWMYYVGFQIPKRCKFLAFTGLAISKDNGLSFTRYSKVPVLDRMTNCETINAVHSVIVENDTFRVWCGSGNKWIKINGIDYPSYKVTYLESNDGINFHQSIPKVHIPLRNEEYRLGRPRVYKSNSGYFMMFTYANVGEQYLVGSAFSNDGYQWTRSNDPPFSLSSNALNDCGLISYPTFIEAAGKKYIFFNGSNMGVNGIYCATIDNNAF